MCRFASERPPPVKPPTTTDCISVGYGSRFAYPNTSRPDWADYADGRVLSGNRAFELGFVDQLGNFEDAVKRAKKIAAISDANLVEYQQRYDISDLFRLFGQTKGSVLKVDLGMETPKLQAGQLYFLSPTFTH